MKHIRSLLIGLVFAASTQTVLQASAVADPVKLEVSSQNAIVGGLNTLLNKVVTLHLRSGQELSGVVEAVGPSAVRLGSLTGKEFYSAIISIDDISAVVYRAK